MAILAVYDTVGIQDYIFNSNKLAENVGDRNWWQTYSPVFFLK